MENAWDILNNEYGNPSSLHKKGFLAEKIIVESKKNISSIMGCRSDELIFTSGATESNNIGIFGTALYSRKKTIITSAIEHPSVLQPLKFLETKGYKILKIFPNQNGEFKAEDFISKINEDTFLISTMWVNNETGTILPVEEIARLAKLKDKEILVHCDGVQGFCKMPNLILENIDLFSFSGHKFHSPKGIGGLYIKKNTRLKPIFYGGGQEFGIRSGTENVALIKSLSDTISYTQSNIVNQYNLFEDLNSYTLSKLSTIDELNFNNFGQTVPYIINFSIKNIKSEVLIHFLEEYEIYVSSGSACSKNKDSHVLKAFSIDNKLLKSSIRISFGIYNNFEDIDILAEKIRLATKQILKVK